MEIRKGLTGDPIMYIVINRDAECCEKLLTSSIIEFILLIFIRNALKLGKIDNSDFCIHNHKQLSLYHYKLIQKYNIFIQCHQ